MKLLSRRQRGFGILSPAQENRYLDIVDTTLTLVTAVKWNMCWSALDLPLCRVSLRSCRPSWRSLGQLILKCSLCVGSAGGMASSQSLTRTRSTAVLKPDTCELLTLPLCLTVYTRWPCTMGVEVLMRSCTVFSWSKDRRVVLVSSVERRKWTEVRPLPTRKPAPAQFEVSFIAVMSTKYNR